MIERKQGAIVVISSINAMASSPQRAAYGVAKAGLDSLVRTIAIEGAPHGVRCNSVRPGATRTPRRQHLSEGALGELYQREIPIGRLGEPIDVANLVVFLASDLARHITGVHVTIDGGSTIRYSQPAGN
jgi:NAD(P)-dependent dehydrogenase (short-subunit alcohol dehydrogenase family)